MLVKCPSCKGGGKIMGLGMVYRKCVACTGTGQKQVQPAKVVEAVKPETTISDQKHPSVEIEKKIDLPLKQIETQLKPLPKVEEKPKNVKGSNSHGKKRK